MVVDRAEHKRVAAEPNDEGCRQHPEGDKGVQGQSTPQHAPTLPPRSRERRWRLSRVIGLDGHVPALASPRFVVMATSVRPMIGAYADAVAIEGGSAMLMGSAPVVSCAGVPIVACDPATATSEVIRLATTPMSVGVAVHLCNAYTLALADADPRLRDLLTQRGINFPDGKSVVWANRLLHREKTLPTDRVYGPDLMLDVFNHGQAAEMRHFLLGSTDDVLRDLEAALVARFPAARIVGSWSPPFRPLRADERHDQAQRILESQAQLVWVGLGTPKQDFEVALLATEVPAVHVAIGAAFDFISGRKKQAPDWAGRAGLEWVYRWASEPRRLTRRYVWGNTRFVRAVVRDQSR